LDIDVESGYREEFSTLGGGIIAYALEVELETLGLRFQSYVYFAESYAVKRNLLGRQGWLQLIKLGLDDYKSELYLSPNDEQRLNNFRPTSINADGETVLIGVDNLDKSKASRLI